MADQIGKSIAKEKTASEYGAGTTPLSYNSYLRVAQLKELQACQSDHHDEPLFIIIHQTYELWFKLILHELDEVLKLLPDDKVYKATFYLRRVTAIMRLLVNQIHILETMSPKDFLGFRHKLNPASGFQSSQFREVEFICGLKEDRMLQHFAADQEAFAHLKARFEQESLADQFYALLRRRAVTSSYPPDLGEAGLTTLDPAKSEIEAKRINEIKQIYDQPEEFRDLHELAESLVDLDELIAMWRFHHVTVVERVIGFKRGTGGSEGVGYLRSTLSKRCFPDLWNLRTALSI